MRLTEIDFDGRLPVDGYGPGMFRVAGEAVLGDMLLAPGGPVPWDGTPGPLAALAGQVDVVLIGQGPEIAPLDPALAAALEAADLGAEPMSTPAACRTYNVLLGEGRRIALAARAMPTQT